MKNLIKFVTIVFATSLSITAFAQEQQLTEEQINSMMQQMAEQMNKQLPRKVDDIATLSKVGFNNKTFSYFYKIDDLSQLKNIENVQKNMIKIACKTPQTNKFMKDYGFSYHYNYVAPNNEQILDFTIDKNDCNK